MLFITFFSDTVTSTSPTTATTTTLSTTTSPSTSTATTTHLTSTVSTTTVSYPCQDTLGMDIPALLPDGNIVIVPSDTDDVQLSVVGNLR